MPGPPLTVRFSAVPARTAQPPAVLVHGIISGRYLVPLARALGRTQAVFVPELPGFGGTPPLPVVPGVPELADALAGWLRQRRLDRPLLVAHSTGCQVVVHLAVRHPELLGAAVLMGPTGDPRARSLPRHYLRWLRCQLIEPWSFTGLLAREFRDGRVLHALRVFARIVRDPIERKAPRVPVPVLVLRGQRDHVAPADWTRRLTALLPDARTVQLPGASHTLRDQDPVALARLLLAFARGQR